MPELVIVAERKIGIAYRPPNAGLELPDGRNVARLWRLSQIIWTWLGANEVARARCR